MNILLYCLPRTRSHVLQDILSQHYNLENIWEPYKSAEFTAKKVLFEKPDLMNQKFVSAIQSISKQLENKNNYVAKMFPMHTYNYIYYLYTKENYQFSKDDIFDLETMHKISRYDQIYILKRKSLVDCIVSFYFAHYHSQFIFTEKNKSLIDGFRPKRQIKLDIPLEAIKVGVIDYFVLEYQKNWLKNKNFNIIELDYEDVPNYVSTNFPNLQTNHVETKYNYKEFILNYDEISQTINNLITELNLESLSK